MLTGNFQQLHSAGCIQVGADVAPDIRDAIDRFGDLFYALMKATRSNPCNGCPAYNGGKCEAYKRYNTLAQPRWTHERATRVVSAAKRCPECGLRIRGEHHAEGEHHKRKAKSGREA